VVIDVVDIARKHSLQAAPVLYGLPPGLDGKGKRLDELEEGLEEIRAQFPNLDIEELLKHGELTLEALHAQAVTFNVWDIPSLGAFGNGRALNWIKVSESTYRLQYPWGDGTEILTVEPDLVGHWTVALTLRPHGQPGRQPPPVRQRTLAAGIVSSDAAAGVAEAFVLQERRAVTRLKAPDAPWRSKPASPKQLALLNRLRVPHNAKTITCGGASDLIDLAQARRAR
jgi:hypothetical protein